MSFLAPFQVPSWTPYFFLLLSSPFIPTSLSGSSFLVPTYSEFLKPFNNECMFQEKLRAMQEVTT